MLFYGAGDEAWKRTIDNELKKMAGYRGGKPLPAIYTYLAEPRTDDKTDLIDMEEPGLIDGLDGFAEAAMAKSHAAADRRRSDPMSAATASPQINPFPGLRPFREDEEHLFFGRENQVDAMVNKLAATRFLAVVGTSGSGKSSLVNCGLRPALRQGLMARAGTAWRMAQFRPGSDPIGAMARALAQDGVLFRDDRRGRPDAGRDHRNHPAHEQARADRHLRAGGAGRGRQSAGGGGPVRRTVSLPAIGNRRQPATQA